MNILCFKASRHYPNYAAWVLALAAILSPALVVAHEELQEASSGKHLAPLAVGTTNLMANAGFEEAESRQRATQIFPKWEVVGEEIPRGWDYNGDQAGRVTLIDDPQQARHGRRVLKIEKLDDHRSAQVMSGGAPMPLTPAQMYRVSLWVRGKGLIRVFAHENSTENRYLYSRQLAEYRLSSDWNMLDLEYKVPATAGKDNQPVGSVRYAIGLLPQGEMYIDDFEVRRAPQIAVPRAERLE
jgi:hypothetical protein